MTRVFVRWRRRAGQVWYLLLICFHLPGCVCVVVLCCCRGMVVCFNIAFLCLFVGMWCVVARKIWYSRVFFFRFVLPFVFSLAYKLLHSNVCFWLIDFLVMMWELENCFPFLLFIFISFRCGRNSFSFYSRSVDNQSLSLILIWEKEYNLVSDFRGAPQDNMWVAFSFTRPPEAATGDRPWLPQGAGP